MRVHILTGSDRSDVCLCALCRASRLRRAARGRPAHVGGVGEETGTYSVRRRVPNRCSARVRAGVRRGRAHRIDELWETDSLRSMWHDKRVYGGWVCGGWAYICGAAAGGLKRVKHAAHIQSKGSAVRCAYSESSFSCTDSQLCVRYAAEIHNLYSSASLNMCGMLRIHRHCLSEEIALPHILHVCDLYPLTSHQFQCARAQSQSPRAMPILATLRTDGSRNAIIGPSTFCPAHIQAHQTSLLRIIIIRLW